MGKYLDYFPKTKYSLVDEQYADFHIITDITFRVSIIKEVLSNFAAYTKYTIKDGETPEILADRFYGSPDAYWIILYANNIYDPQFDWPLGYAAFANYITDKYGSVATAKTTYHHYEKVITRENRTDDIISTTRFQINQTNAAASMATTVPYDTYNSLAVSAYQATNIVGGKTVIETVSRNAVTNYDWEFEQNEAKRFIKVIKKQYYPQIIAEFNAMTKKSMKPGMRTLK